MQPRLEPVASLLEHAARSDVPRKRQRVHPRQRVRRDRVAGERNERVGRNPASPERFAEPVADLGGDALHVGTQHEADAADGLFVHRNGERGLRGPVANGPDVFARVVAGVRMRERIAQIEPDLAVVGMAPQRLGIGRPPRPYFARLELQLHLVTWSFSHSRAFSTWIWCGPSGLPAVTIPPGARSAD